MRNSTRDMATESQVTKSQLTEFQYHKEKLEIPKSLFYCNQDNLNFLQS